MAKSDILEHDLNKLKVWMFINILKNRRIKLIFLHQAKHMNDSLYARSMQHNVQDAMTLTAKANSTKMITSADLPLPAQIHIDNEYSEITPLFPNSTTIRGYDRILRALPLVEYRMPAGSPVTFKWDNVLGSMSLCKNYKPHVIQLAMEIEKRQNEMSCILMHRLNAMAYEYRQTDEYQQLRKRILTTFAWPRILEQFSVGEILHEIQENDGKPTEINDEINKTYKDTEVKSENVDEAQVKTKEVSFNKDVGAKHKKRSKGTSKR